MNKIIKSRVIFHNYLNCEFSSHIEVRQGECLFSFLFNMHINYSERENIKGAGCIDIGIEKLFILLYADEIVYFLGGIYMRVSSGEGGGSGS